MFAARWCKVWDSIKQGGVIFAILLVLNVPASALRAVELVEFKITESQGVYSIEATTLLDASAPHVRSALTDLVHIYRVSPEIIESEILPSADKDSVRVRTRVLGCVAFFCNEIERVEDVRELPSGDLESVMVPELSSFRSGSAGWRIESIGGRTRVIYQAQMEPDFFIPPLIGSYFVKQKLHETVTTSFAKLELIANIFADQNRRYQTPLTDARIDTRIDEPLMSFRRDVHPILKNNCVGCHATSRGEGYHRTGLSMETYDDLMKGTRYGPVITPGESRHSIFNMLVEGRAGPSLRMPHGQNKPLLDTEIEVLRLWVDQGARNN